MSEKDQIFERIRQGILNFDEEATEAAAREALSRNLSAEACDIMTGTIRTIGDRFSRMELFLPDLLLAADAMKKGLAVLEPELRRSGSLRTRGTIVIGTVKGDIHDLGKSIVCAMLTASGFNVVDLGKDIPPSAFLSAAEKHQPRIVGLSATMTTTIPAQGEVVEYFKALGAREKYRIVIGGAATSREHAEKIGADGHAENASEAVALLERLAAG